MGARYLPWMDNSEELIKVARFVGNRASEHRHDFVEIVFMVRGDCIHKYLNTEMQLMPGDVFVILPHEDHSYIFNSETIIYNCTFYPKALGEDWKSVAEIGGIFHLLMVEPIYRGEIKKQEILHLLPEEAVYTENILKNMIEELTMKKTGFRMVQKANLMKLLSFIGRVWECSREYKLEMNHAKRELLREAFKHIEQNIQNEFHIDELAGMVYLSSSYFRQVFKEITSLTPVEYINRIRVSKASQLLLEYPYPISRIAEMVGVNDVNYFSRIFRSIQGCSPSEYRNKSNLC